MCCVSVSLNYQSDIKKRKAKRFVSFNVCCAFASFYFAFCFLKITNREVVFLISAIQNLLILNGAFSNYWQASQPGSSIAQNFTSVAATAAGAATAGAAALGADDWLETAFI